ncbi:hypothetical protein [Aquisediminimonas sediminicola]|uniref:hypothetical protein n=1 Tax=Alteraquisediminimonas sediminicola TaxID=2676787 RepID=UPI001C8DDA5B|nr:hypothetical protein [Aquisediminimonas sediminicola]
MTNAPNRPSSPKAGGVFIAIGSIGGAVIAGRFGEPVIGFLIGLAAGIAISVYLWLKK